MTAMSITADAISKIKSNKKLRSHRFSNFKMTKIAAGKKSSVFNGEYLKSKFSLNKKEEQFYKINLERRNQKILNWTFWFLILISLIYVYNIFAY